MRVDTKFRKAITVEKRIAISLYTLGTCAENRTIASLFGVGRTTVGEIFLDFCYAVVEAFEREYLNFYPATEEKIMEITSGFERLWGFPQTYGAIGKKTKYFCISL